jgi:undecaprenyl-diphosphatase
VLVAGWAALLFGSWGVGALLTSAKPGFDGALTRSLHGPRSGAWTSVMRTITWLGSPVWLDVAFGVALVSLLLARAWRQVLFLVLASPGTVLLTQSLKALVDRHRPYVSHLTAASGPSYPSGHAASTTALYGALLVLAIRSGRLRGGAATTGALGLAVLLGLVGLSRVVLGVHYPTDVLAAWLITGAWLTLVRTEALGRLSAT